MPRRPSRSRHRTQTNQPPANPGRFRPVCPVVWEGGAARLLPIPIRRRQGQEALEAKAGRPAHVADPLGCDHPEFGQMRARRVHQIRPLPDQQIPRLEDHRGGLLLGTLHRDEAHRRTLRRLDDGSPVGCGVPTTPHGASAASFFCRSRTASRRRVRSSVPDARARRSPAPSSGRCHTPPSPRRKPAAPPEKPRASPAAPAVDTTPSRQPPPRAAERHAWPSRCR